MTHAIPLSVDLIQSVEILTEIRRALVNQRTLAPLQIVDQSVY